MLSSAVERLNQAFADRLQEELPADAGLAPFVDALAGLDAAGARGRPPATNLHPALVHLAAALANLKGDPALIAAIRETIRHVVFDGCYGATGPGAGVSEAMVWGEIAGSSGLVRTTTMRLGFFLLSPSTVYPLHGHHALEIYDVVAGSMAVEHGFDGARHDLVAPAYSITPAGMAHALHAGPEPVLIVYCHTGDLRRPVWWWKKDAAGNWRKTAD